MSQQINLFNPAFKKQNQSFSLLTMLQALGVIVLGAALFYGYADYQGRQLARQYDESLKRFNAEQEHLARLRAEFSPEQAGQALQAEVRQWEKKLSEQARVIGALKSGGGGNAVGYSEYMRAFSRQVVPGLWLTSFEVIDGTAQININGKVLKPELLPIYVQRLSRESALHGKLFSSLQMSADAGSVAFKLHSTPDAGGAK